MINIDLIGYLAGGIIAIALLPQVIKAWKTKSTKDISIVWSFLYLTGLSLWLIYAIEISSNPLIFTVIIESFMALSLLVLKLVYK